LVSEQKKRAVKQCIYGAAAMAGLLMVPMPASAADPIIPSLPQTISVPLIEWDLPADADMQPGGIVVDTQGHDKNRVWFVTRLAGARAQKVYKLEPSKSLMAGVANWSSWELSPTEPVPGFTGGLRKMKPSWDRRYVFVRTDNSLQRIDTQNCSGYPKTCVRTVWRDQQGPNASDVAVDDWNRVFSTAAIGNDPTTGYVQMLTPGAAPAYGQTQNVTVTRWIVGGGAGGCVLSATSPSGPCLSGIAVLPSNRKFVYYSEPSGLNATSGLPNGNIAELNVETGKVRRWNLGDFAADLREPRQLNIDRYGKIWVNTGSGDLVSLDPYSGRMTRHQIPGGATNDTFGNAPDDDVVGYTVSNSDRVGMVHPKGTAKIICPAEAIICPTYPPVPVVREDAAFDSGCVSPQRKDVTGSIFKNPDGTYVEAMLSSGNDSFLPLGITPNKGKAEGTFFYAVGANGATVTDPETGEVLSAKNRVGFVRLQLKEKVKHPREDDDPDDGCDDHQNHDGPDGHHGHKHHRHGENDWDDDGLDDRYDDHKAQDNVDTRDDAPLAAGQIGQYTVVTSATSLALIATATADNALAQIGCDIYGPTGLLAATAPPTPGLAVATVLLPAPGTYTVKIRNYGLSPIVATPMFVVREPQLP